jgi:hypothetical protein
MKKILRYGFVLLAGLVVGTLIRAALADYNYPDPVSGNRVVTAFVCATTKICPAQVIMDSSGAEKLITGNPGIIDTGSSGNLINAVKGTLTIDTGSSGNLINAVKAPLGLSTTGGWTPFFKAGLTTTPTAVKTSAGQLGFVQCDNANASYAYVQIFNLATGSVTLGVSTPTQVLPMPSNLSNGFVMNLAGMQYSTAISVAATTTATGAAAPGSPLNCTFGYN